MLTGFPEKILIPIRMLQYIILVLWAVCVDTPLPGVIENRTEQINKCTRVPGPQTIRRPASVPELGTSHW